MKKIYWLFSALLLFTACNQDKEEPKVGGVIPVSQITHVALHRLQGNVQQLRRVEMMGYDEATGVAQDSIVSIFRFDVAGHIVFYDQSGISEMPIETLPLHRNGIYNGGEVYEYVYDNNGNLKEVKVTLPGEGQPHLYTFLYGTHGYAVPSPLVLGELADFPLSNLISVTYADKYRYEWKDGKMQQIAENYMGTVISEYSFLPKGVERLSVVTKKGVDTLSFVETIYERMPNGFLQSSVQYKKDKYGEEAVKNSYHLNLWNASDEEQQYKIVEKKPVLQLRTIRSYETHGWLAKNTQYRMLENGKEEEKVLASYEYKNFDKKGNWTFSKVLMASPWGIGDPEFVMFKQEITYYP